MSVSRTITVINLDSPIGDVINLTPFHPARLDTVNSPNFNRDKWVHSQMAMALANTSKKFRFDALIKRAGRINETAIFLIRAGDNNESNLDDIQHAIDLVEEAHAMKRGNDFLYDIVDEYWVEYLYCLRLIRVR